MGTRKLWRDGKAVTAHKDTQARKARKKAKEKFNGQKKKANTRAKYGPSMKPAPVTVKRLNGVTGEWEVEETLDQSKLGAGPVRRSRR